MSELESEKKKANYAKDYYEKNKEKARLYGKMYYWRNKYNNYIGIKKPKKRMLKVLDDDENTATIDKSGPIILTFE
jgi:hypothetical protein